MPYEIDYSPILDAWPALLAGLWLSIRLSAFATLIGLLIAIVLAVGKLAGRACCAWPSMRISS